ncbi:hypothetical protein FEM48_Zijuj05G0016300 [Ziziphus jujuba var. spinosa]|uniref:DUF4220 domain-containing protein n=1 Tax=Ziziphus jujuba var. spinosa TaxID=714518 RepID=A0A978VC20_ZIZJJ|nr:hypothetical protein FEM48_Zijuj05G0016300 [Ziziphus jujuba var. spinosa]
MGYMAHCSVKPHTASFLGTIRTFQVLGAGYSFFLTLPKNQLCLLTILVFIVGTIKYAERTIALYLASLDCFGSTTLPKPYPGPDCEEAIVIYSTTRSVEVLEQTEITMALNWEISETVSLLFICKKR